MSRARNAVLAGGLALTAGVAGAGGAYAAPGGQGEGATVLQCERRGAMVFAPNGVTKYCTGPPVAKSPAPSR